MTFDIGCTDFIDFRGLDIMVKEPDGVLCVVIRDV